jgi:hypothetical protein
MADNHIVTLIGVYAADGGIRGELAYIAGRYLKGQHCGLCDITHSPIRRRKEWDDFTSRLGVPFDLVHRNERDVPTRLATEGGEPCVAAKTSSGDIIIVLSATDLLSVHTVREFSAALAESLRAHHLQLPASPPA